MLSSRSDAKLKKGLFLDCDGVICELIDDSNSRGPRDLSELRVQASARMLIKQAQDQGFICIVITNQPDISRGLTTAKSIQDVQTAIRNEIPEISEFFTCPHVTEEACLCRKPKPFMITRAAAEHSIDLSQSIFIGDRWTDILAAKRAGVRSLLVSGWHSWLPSSDGLPPADLKPDYVCDELSQVKLEDLR